MRYINLHFTLLYFTLTAGLAESNGSLPPGGWLPVHRDKLRAHRSVSSMGSLYLFLSNQKMLYFPTSPNWCFCTIWGNKKPRNCVFSLKCCMLFYQKHTKHIKNITWSKSNYPSLSKWSNGCTKRDQEANIVSCSMLPHTSCLPILSLCWSLCQKWTCSSLSMEWMSMDSIAGM